MEILAALGMYKEGTLEQPGIHITLQYDPGTVVAITGRGTSPLSKMQWGSGMYRLSVRKKI